MRSDLFSFLDILASLRFCFHHVEKWKTKQLLCYFLDPEWKERKQWHKEQLLFMFLFFLKALTITDLRPTPWKLNLQ